MKRFKKSSLLLIVIMLTVMTTGCLQYDFNLELNRNNTGKLIIASAVDRDIMDAFEAEGGSDEDITLVDNLPKGFNVKRTELKYKDGEQTYEGEEVEVSFDNTRLFIEELAKDNDQNLRIVDLPNGNTRIEVDLDSVGAQDPFLFYGMMADLGGKIKFTIKTDYNVIKHNANSVNNGIYSWDILTTLVNSPDPRMESFYLEYTSEDKEPLPSFTGKTRKEVEKYLEIKLNDRDFHGKALEKLGILKGTEKGLELKEGLTRAQGATMYARLLGAEMEIEKFVKFNPNYNSGFTDVPAWAKSTIDYLHAKGLINGISKTEYGSSNMMTLNDYTTLVLRALGYDDSKGDFQWDSAGTQSEKIGLYSEDELKPDEILGDKSFTRGSMSYVSYNALFFKSAKTNDRLIDKLIR